MIIQMDIDCVLYSNFLENKLNKIKFYYNNFTLEYLSEGIKGLAKFTKEHIINSSEDGKQKYICSDPSRALFK